MLVGFILLCHPPLLCVIFNCIPCLLLVQCLTAVYEAQETRQQLLPPAPGEALDGGMLCLPHRVAVELQLVPGDDDEGGLPGLQLSTWWQPCEGTLVSMTRRYAPDGRLETVGAATAVRDSL